MSVWNGVIFLVALLCATTSAADPERAAPAPPVNEAVRRPLTVPLPPEVTAAAQSGVQLRRWSQSAFQRGLLNLGDHLEHLSAAEEAEVRLVAIEAKDTDNPTPELRQALQPRIDALRLAVQQMAAFRQPAAANWEADLRLGQYVLAQAEEEAAGLVGDRSAVMVAKGVQQHWAQAHYARRVFDARFLGHATPSEVTQAITFLNISPVRKREALQRTVSQMKQWQRTGAGIGRADRTLDAQLQLALWDVESRGSQTSASELRRGLVEADRLTARLFDVQREFHQHGTASLADLSRSWQTRRQVHLLANWVALPLPDQRTEALDRSSRELTHLAAGVKDHRGRMAADVEYVRLLGLLHVVDRDELRDRRVASSATNERDDATLPK